MFSKDDIFIYIFSWKKVTESAKQLYTNIATVCPHTWFLNCDENNHITDIPNVIQLDDSYYYGGQFETALKHIPKNKILCCIVGDVSPDAPWATIIDNAVIAFNTKKVGIYAPDVDYTWHTSRKNNLWGSLYEVDNPDCTCWFICPTIWSLISVLPYKQEANLGWGIDHICCDEARRNNLFVARDYSVTVSQPRGTNYNQQLAAQQMTKIKLLYSALLRYLTGSQIA